MAIPAERAGALRRIGALFIDWAIASFTTALIYPLQASSLEPTLVRLAIFVFEVGLLTSFGGASIGKRVFGIRVVTWPDYYFVKPGAAFLRVFLVVLVLPALFIDSEGRGFHERISKTTIIRIRR
jgi:uncharacterized RDD family membrane protein YckC